MDPRLVALNAGSATLLLLALWALSRRGDIKPARREPSPTSYTQGLYDGYLAAMKAKTQIRQSRKNAAQAADTRRSPDMGLLQDIKDAGKRLEDLFIKRRDAVSKGIQANVAWIEDEIRTETAGLLAGIRTKIEHDDARLSALEARLEITPPAEPDPNAPPAELDPNAPPAEPDPNAPPAEPDPNAQDHQQGGGA